MVSQRMGAIGPLFLLMLLAGGASAKTVSSISHYWIREGGSELVQLTGEGFSDDQFNHFDTLLGNKVYFVNEADTMKCNVIMYKTTTTRIFCETIPRVRKSVNRKYKVVVSVDGEEVYCDKYVEFSSWDTPRVRSISPRMHLPGTLVEFYGWLKSDNVWIFNTSDAQETGNDDFNYIKEVYLGNVECDFYDDEKGELYGELTGNNLFCLPKTKYIGPMNGTLLVSNKGASINDKWNLYVDSQDRIYLTHSYAGLSSVSPQVSGSNGGTEITITGKYFDPKPGQTKVTVGGAECVIKDIADESLTCIAPPHSQTGPAPGERGWLYETWAGIGDAWEDANFWGDDPDEPFSTYTPSHSNYNATVVDSLLFNIPLSGGVIARLSGYLHVAHDGKYALAVGTGDGSHQHMRIATNGNPQNKTAIGHWHRFNAKASTPVFVEIVIKSAELNEIHGYMNDFNGKYNYYQNAMSRDERHDIKLDPRHTEEVQRVEIQGTPANSFSFFINGITSNPIDITDTEKVKEEILSMASYTCEIDDGDNPKIYYLTDYEDDPEDFPPNTRGSADATIEPYCGRKSLKLRWDNPRLLDTSDTVKMVDMVKYKFVCFAYRGLFKGDIGVTIEWYDKWNRARRDSVYLEDALDDSLNDEWTFKCWDLHEAFENSWMATYVKEGTYRRVRYVKLPYPNYMIEMKTHVDYFFFSSVKVSVDRTPSAFDLNGILLDDVVITPVNDSIYDIEFVRSNCGADFPLLGIASSEANQVTLANAQEFTFNLDGGIKVVTSRQEIATHDITGTWDMVISGESINDISTDIEGYELANLIKDAIGSDGIRVEKSGSCHYQYWKIRYDSIPGEQNLPILKKNNIVFEGEKITLEAKRGSEGKTYHDNIQGDFLSVRREEPHVAVIVNGYRAVCLGNCSFSYSDSGSPTLTSLSPTSGNLTGNLTIQGSGFSSSNITDYSVMVGDKECTVTAVTTTEITCTLPSLTSGNHPVTVSMQPVGYAGQPSSSLSYTMSLSVTSVKPTTGGTGGGYSVEIVGTGFPETLKGWNGNSVTIGGEDCPITAAAAGIATCTVPSGSAGTVDVVANVNGESGTFSNGFTYDATLSSLVSSVSPTVAATVLGGETLTITGSNFDTQTSGKVLVGEEECMIETWSTSSITCTLPSNVPGTHPVTVITSLGKASGSFSVTYTLKVKSSSEAQGSVNGGVYMVFNGEGFGSNCSLLKITMGDTAECEITECSDTQISCITKTVSKNHVITNLGELLNYGVGFAWSSKSISVNVGDTVTWKWVKASAVSQLLYNVYQMSSPTDKQYDGKGFKSGAPSEKGSFTVKFPSTGKFYYGGDPIYEDKQMTGNVVVYNHCPDNLKVTVSLGGIAASYEPDGSSVDVTVSGCTTLLTTDIDSFGCKNKTKGEGKGSDLSTVGILITPLKPPHCSLKKGDPSNDTLYFMSDICKTPVITNITASATENVAGISGITVIANTTFTITGEGFGTELCQTSVTVGDSDCTVTSTSNKEITCTLGSQETLTSIKPAQVSVNVINRGLAILNVENYEESLITVVPVLASFSPSEGSTAGGTEITITGTGLRAFDNIARVSMGGTLCDVKSVTSISIICSTGPAAASTLTITVMVSQYNIQAINELADSTFTYNDTLTPSVTDVSYSDQSANITGTGFGTNSSKVAVTFTPTSSRRKRSLNDESIVKNEKFFAQNNKVHTRRVRDTSAIEANANTFEYEEDEQPRNIYKPMIDSKRFDNMEDTSDFWGKFTGSNARTLTESIEMGTWRRAGSKFKRAQKEEDSEIDLKLSKRSIDAKSYECNPSSVSDTEIICDTTDMPAGSYDIIVNIEGLGDAVVDSGSISTDAVASSIDASMGSIKGGALVTISGSGFNPGAISVTIDGVQCSLVSEAPESITCHTPPHDAGVAPVVVTSNGKTAPGSLTYTYSDLKTPAVSSVSPSISVSSGNSLTVTGTKLKLSGTDPDVLIDGESCTISSSSDTSIICTAPDKAGGTYSIVVSDATYGKSNSNITVNYSLNVGSLTPNEAGFGGVEVTVTGKGFEPSGSSGVTVCGESCTVISASSTSITCTVPPKTQEASSTEVCDVVVTNSNGDSSTLSSGFTYSSSLTAALSSISPTRGGTAGGTNLTIVGTGFASSGNAITIDDVECVISSESTTSITCVTEAHSGPGSYPVTVTIPGKGIADTSAADEFFYIDRWSSRFTWGGDNPPLEEEFVLIEAGQTILLDESTPVLKMLLIKGGHVVFDPDASSEIVLRAEYILILDGGSLNIGSEEEPYQGEAVIELHGHVLSIELPVYGAKVLAVRNGTLDIHGAYIPVTWTHLASTASPGDNTITLKQPVTWKAGDQIVIATTEKMFIENENEQMTIALVSPNGLTITLTEPLKHEHISIEQTFAGQTIETRAEVGLLTRNVKIRGDVNPDFVELIPACDEKWKPGQFDKQSCFNGRYGEEIGTAQFGATVMLMGKFPNQDLVAGRISYTEVTEAGQAFQLGRYPLHFHLVGNVSSSYIRGCAVHRTYNRAVTIHAADYLTVEKNVVYNNLGHAIFTEDGVERYNVIQYNLAIFTRTSSSLLNVDITPASYWVVNPNNIVRHNAAAGGTHFGYWYRAERHPSGPSATNDYCPNNEVMGQFYNNTAHSFGRYGLWVFSMDGMFPKDDTCGGHDLVAEWNDFTVWHCERGAEVVFGGAVQFHNMVALDNLEAGLEMVDVRGKFGQNDGPGIFNSLLIGHSALSPDEGCGDGIVAPKKKVFSIANCTFVNFDRPNCSAMSGCSQCKPNNVAYEVQVKDLKFENADQKLQFKWPHEQIWIDADGSLTGTPENVVIPNSNILPSQCTKDVTEFSGNPQAPGSVCSPPMSFHRVSMDGSDKIKPSSLMGRSLNISNSHGTDQIVYFKKRLSSKEGWAAYLYSGDTFKFAFDYSEAIQNISYNAYYNHFSDEDYLYIQHDFIQTPDGFGTVTNDQRNSSDSIPDPVDSIHGDYYWNEDDKTMTYIVKRATSRKRREVIFEDRNIGSDRRINFDVWRCLYDGCIPPTAPPPVPVTTYRWSDPETWKNVPVGSGGHPDENTYGLPVQYDSIIIPDGMRLLVDTTTPQLRIIQVYGILEFEDTMDHVFDATIIYVRGDGTSNGKIVAGYENSAFTNNLKIILRGDLNPNNPDNTPMPPIAEISLGWKAIGVFGLLSLHGQDVGKTWVKLGASATAGSTQVTLNESVTNTWLNKEVMITATGKESEETEVHTVTDVSSDGLTLTLDTALEFDHLGETHSLSDGTTYSVAGEVGLMSRNIVIEGGYYNDLIKDSFGGRVLVSKINVGGDEFIGTANLSNVEFHNMGQEGFIDDDDPRYALALHTLGSSTSFVKKCSFNHNFNTAIGLFATDNVLIEDNVVYHTVSSSIRDDSSATIFHHNLVSTMLWPGAYQDRQEVQNFNWYAAFYLNFASGTVMKDNVVAGSDQAGYATFGELCAENTNWSNNEVHSAAFGVMLWKKAPGPADECRRIDNVYAWRIWDTAFYIQTYASVIVQQTKVADSQLGMNLLIHNPPALSHEFYDKTASVKDSLFIGASPSHTCEYDDYVPSLKEQIWGSKLWDGGVNGGNTAMFIGSFLSKKNKAPKHPFHPPDVYPAIRGSTHVDSVTFANYNNRSCGKDVAISTNPDAEDAIHPTFTNGLTFLNSSVNNYIYMHKPNLGSVNPSDCVDMTCDGLKKAIVTDSDGSLLGTAEATATAIAEYEWDGDGSHGVGDYRIPNSLKTNTDGSDITAAEKFPNKGIIRNDGCTLNNEWRAWKCTGLKHRMMVIESMDADTEVRRLSPIALIANPGKNGYVDLLNGPMDRGWCFGYTCQERISTFYSVVASGTIYEMSLTSTPPQVLRFHLLNADPTEAVVIQLFFSKTQRYDIYVDDVYVPPKNIDTSKDSYQLLPEDDSFFPILDDPVGSNYLQRNSKLLHFVVKGGHTIDVKTTPAIVVSTGLVIEEGNFFEENVVENLALLLGVPVENIRVVKVIREDSTRRRRGTSQKVTVQTEIASAPSSNLNGSDTSSNTNFTGSALSFDDLEVAAAKMATAFQTGSTNTIGNFTLANVEIADPIPPPPKEPPPKASKEQGSVIIEGGDLFSNVQQKEEEEKIKQTETKSYDKPGGLAVNATIDGKPIAFITIQDAPVITVVDANGKPMETLGHPSDPWIFTASLTGGSAGAKLLGDVKEPFKNGKVTFSNIAVSKPGKQYSLIFDVTYPENVTALVIGMGKTFSVADKSLSLIVPTVEGPLTALVPFNFGPFIIWDNDLNATVNPAALADQKMSGKISVVRERGSPKLSKKNSRFSVSGEGIADFTAKNLKLNNRPFVDVRFAVDAIIEPAGWKLSDSNKKGEGLVLLPKNVVMPAEPLSKTFTMVAVRGNANNLKGKEVKFELEVQKYLLRKVGKAYYSDVKLTLNKRASVKITVMGSAPQIFSAQLTICNLMKKYKLKVKLKGAGRFKFQNLSVDGKPKKACNRGRLIFQTNQVVMDVHT